MVAFQTDIAVNIGIPIFRYLIFVKFYTNILKYFQTILNVWFLLTSPNLKLSI